MSVGTPATELDFARPQGSPIHAALARLRERPGVPMVRYQGAPAAILTRYDDVVSALRNEDEIPAAAAYRIHSEPAQGRTLLCMEGGEHRVNRALALAPFSPRGLADTDGQLASLAHGLVDQFAERGHADLVEEFTHRFSFLVILSMLGIPEDDHPHLHRWSLDLLNYAYHPSRALAAKAAFTDYLKPVLAGRRREPGHDLLSMLTMAEVDGVQLGDEEICSFARLLFPAGADTSYLGVGNLLFALLRRPEVLRLVRDSPELRRRAVEEALRWESPAAILPRFAPNDVEIAGTAIAAGTPLLVAITAANRDPARYADQDTYDLDRAPTGAATFGWGAHFCLGAHLARREMLVALEVVLDRLPGLELADDACDIVGSVLRGPNRLPVRFVPQRRVHV